MEIQPGFEPGSSEFWSNALNNWATGALALEQKLDGPHSGEDKYEQELVPSVLNPFFFTGLAGGLCSNTDLAYRVETWLSIDCSFYLFSLHGLRQQLENQPYPTNQSILWWGLAMFSVFLAPCWNFFYQKHITVLVVCRKIACYLALCSNIAHLLS